MCKPRKNKGKGKNQNEQAESEADSERDDNKRMHGSLLTEIPSGWFGATFPTEAFGRFGESSIVSLSFASSRSISNI